jgi:uncharacterized membrane protein YedE/YeeE
MEGAVTEFTPYASALGGIMIGLSAVLLMALHGRIAGMTGIVSGVLTPATGDWQWRVAFLAGTILAPVIYMAATGTALPFYAPISTAAMIGGGLIVGVGVIYGSGCTSGHGVCGIARFSPRSIVATAVFMAATFATVYLVRHAI